MRLTATSWSRGSPAWWPGRCRWPRANTCRCTPRRTPNRPTSKLERAELKTDDEGERKELTAIYVARGLDPALAEQVAEQLMAHDALGAHARDELGISAAFSARPIQAAMASAACFAVGAAMPLAVTAVAPGAGSDSGCLRNLAIVPGASGRVGGARRGRGRGAGRNPRRVLGRAGDGRDGRRRGAVRNRGGLRRNEANFRDAGGRLGGRGVSFGGQALTLGAAQLGQSTEVAAFGGAQAAEDLVERMALGGIGQENRAKGVFLGRVLRGGQQTDELGFDAGVAAAVPIPATRVSTRKSSSGPTGWRVWR